MISFVLLFTTQCLTGTISKTWPKWVWESKMNFFPNFYMLGMEKPKIVIIKFREYNLRF